MVNQMAPRVDFKHVRQHGSFEAVCAAYDITLIKDGPKPGQFKALCPFHDDTKPSLKINTERNIYNCFVCGAGGNILEFVREIENLGPDGLRAAALKVAEISGISPTPNGPAPTKVRRSPSAPASPPPAAETPASAEPDGEPYNQVLTFELKMTNDAPLTDWLASRGISEQMAKTFGLGRVGKKSKTMPDRLGIPIHNTAGKVVAYCGRYIGNVVPDDVPKYKFPPNFRKELEVFNLHRAITQIDGFKTFLVFESYFSVMRFHEHAAAISFMGRSVSPAQLATVVEHLKSAGAQRAFVVADGDQPGYDGAQDIAGALAPHFWARVLDLEPGEKPHRLEWNDLRARLRDQW